MAESVAAQASKEAAEASYEKFRAGLELKLTQEIQDWRDWIEADPPRMHVCSDSIDATTDELDEHMVTNVLWLRFCAYLQAETLNFAAILLHRGMRGHEAVDALRAWVEQLCESARRYKWEPALRSVSVEDLTLNWPRENICIELSAPYEQAFWEAATDPSAVADLWDAAGWWDPQEPQAPTTAADTDVSDEDRSRVRTAWLDERELSTGLSDLDVEKKGGPTYNTIRRWRSGIRSNRHPYVRGRFAKVFDCKPEEVPE